LKLSSLAAAVVVLAAAVLYAVQTRYVIAPRDASPAVIIYRLDRWTGELIVLQRDGDAGWKAARLGDSPPSLRTVLREGPGPEIVSITYGPTPTPKADRH
jgi:hypothetical protein